MRCPAIHCVGNRGGECALFELSGPGPCREFELRPGAVCQHQNRAGTLYHGPYGLEVCRECLATRKYVDSRFGGLEYYAWRPYPEGWVLLEWAFGPETVAELLGQRAPSDHCPHI